MQALYIMHAREQNIEIMDVVVVVVVVVIQPTPKAELRIAVIFVKTQKLVRSAGSIVGRLAPQARVL